MTIQIRKASRKQSKLRLGLAAPSGCGKTMGALLLAYGITDDWEKIGLIDTEEGSGELYVGVNKHSLTIGDYLYSRISGSFAPKHYIEHIKAMENAGAEVIIVDSLTHAWAGTEGLLDKQAKIAERSGNSYTAWRDVTPDHNALVNAMLQSKSHIIATMRSKVQYAMEKGDDDKYKIVKKGIAPIQREGMEYEFTAFFDIDANCYASASKDRTDLFSELNAAGTVEKKHFIIKPDTGKMLKDWIGTGDKAEPSERDLLIKDIEELIDVVDLPPDNSQYAFILNNRYNLFSFETGRLEKMKLFLQGNNQS